MEQAGTPGAGGQRRGAVPPSEPHAMSPIASPMLSTELPRIVLQSDPCILEKRELHQTSMDWCHKQQDRPRAKSGGPRGSSCSCRGNNIGRLVSARGFLIASCPLLSCPAASRNATTLKSEFAASLRHSHQ